MVDIIVIITVFAILHAVLWLVVGMVSRKEHQEFLRKLEEAKCPRRITMRRSFSAQLAFMAFLIAGCAVTPVEAPPAATNVSALAADYDCETLRVIRLHQEAMMTSLSDAGDPDVRDDLAASIRMVDDALLDC